MSSRSAGFARERDDVGADARGLGVDVDADDARVRHRHGGAGDEAGLRAGAAGAVHDRGRRKARLRGLRFDLGDGRGIGDRAQRVRDAVGHEVGLVPLRLEIVDQRANGGVAVAGPWHVMEMRAEQAVEERVAGGFVFRRRRCEAAVIDGEMAGKTEFCGGRRDLPLAVRLHDAAGDDRIGAAGNGFMQDVVELAQLVAAEAEPGGVLALHPQPRSAEMRGQPLHRFERGRQGGEAEAGKGGEPVGEPAST